MSDVTPLRNSSGNVTAQMLLDKAQTLVDTMDGALLVWYEQGSGREQVRYLTSNLTTKDANWFIDEIKTLLHNREL